MTPFVHLVTLKLGDHTVFLAQSDLGEFKCTVSLKDPNDKLVDQVEVTDINELSKVISLMKIIVGEP